MVSSTALALLTALTAYLLNIFIPWIRNVRIAKASGLPYVLVPYYSYHRLRALIMARTVLRICARFLGPSSPTSWRTLVGGNYPLKHRHEPFAALGTDTFLTVAPGGILLHTADASVVAQIMSRQQDFPKASHMYKSVSIYGDNVVASEGLAWRHHRKLMSPVFGENNNQLVWTQSLYDAQNMLSTWLRAGNEPVTTLASDTMLLSLSVIGRAGLGQNIQWLSAPAATEKGTPEVETLPAGHQMSFTAALTTILENIYYVVLLPRWVLRKSSMKVIQKTHLAYLEWGHHMREMISSKREAMTESKPDTTTTITHDLLTQLLKEHEQGTVADVKPSTTKRAPLTDSEILGNLFVMVLAGHETTANSIHFCLALLAMNPSIQREVQSELDQIFCGRDPTQWNYERDLPVLLNSKLNAVLNEQLRLLGPVVVIPKYTHAPQPLNVDGKHVTVPANTVVRVCIPSLHRNPACWPTSNTTKSDLEIFRPSRWFNPDGSWYSPPRGSYVPFSDGARACLGRRFAQVEVLAVLALILAGHSVELAIDDDKLDKGDEDGNADEDAQIQNAIRGEEKLRDAWTEARDRAEWVLREKMSVIITLQIIKGFCVPVNIVKRGDERFAGIV